MTQLVNFLGRVFRHALWRCACLLLMTSAVYAEDYFDGSVLTIPMVTVGGATYTNLQVTLTAITGNQPISPLPGFDQYMGGLSLFVPEVYYAGNQYNNYTFTLGSIVKCCSAINSTAYLIIANPNDQTIRSYGYTSSSHPTSVVTDPALASLNPSKQAKLFLDKSHGILFDVVPSASGTFTVTPFPFNVVTGVIGTPGQVSSYSAASSVTVNTNLQEMYIISSSGSTVTIYSYNSSTGAISSAPVAAQTNAVLGSIMNVSSQDSLAFGLSGSTLATYPITSSGLVFTPRATTSTNLLFYSGGSARDIDAQYDATNGVVFMLATPKSAGSTGSEIQSASYSSNSLSPTNSPVSLANSSYICGLDSVRRFIFVPASNGPQISTYSYDSSGNLTLSSTESMSNSGMGSLLNFVGGCNDVDQDNQIVVFANDNPATVTYFLYDKLGNISQVPAGSVNLATGSLSISVITTSSVKH